MNRSDIEILTDEIIGEAVMLLLKSKGPITTRTLMVALQMMESTETDTERHEAIARGIAEISKMTSEQYGSGRQITRSGRNSTCNVFPLLGESALRNSGKVH